MVKVLSDECQSPAKMTCRPYGPEAGRISGSASSGAYLTSDLFAISLVDNHCLLSDNLVKIPDAAARTLSSYLGAYTIFVGGTCDGRWSTVISYNASSRCANISSSSGSWADGLAACSSSSGDWYLAAPSAQAEPAYPPMRCPSCPASTGALVTDRGGGRYLVSYSPTGRGAYSILGYINALVPPRVLRACWRMRTCRDTEDQGLFSLLCADGFRRVRGSQQLTIATRALWELRSTSAWANL